jgi:hypothetical protein
LNVRIGEVIVTMTNTEISAAGNMVMLADVTAVSFPGWNHVHGASNRVVIASRTSTVTIAMSVAGRSLSQPEHDSLQEVLDRLWTGVVPRVVADAVDHVAYGLTLNVGALRIERHGFGSGAHMYPWSLYAGTRFHVSGVEVMRHDGGGTTPVALVGSGDTNAPAVTAILGYLASHGGRSQPMSDAERRAIDLGPRPRVAFVAAPLLLPTSAAPAKKRRERGQAGKLVSALAVVALLGLRGYAMVKPSEPTTSPARPRATPIAVSAWDPRMTDLVAFVEKDHGRPFKHPVKVSFLDDAAFLARLNDGQPKSNPKKQRTTEAYLRARGYAGSSFSLAASEKGMDGLTGGVYFSDTDEIVIRGNELDAMGKLVVAHELTHAWQHQQYPVDKIQKAVLTDSDLFLSRTLLEGDARRIENRYYRSLPAADQAEIAAAEESLQNRGTPDAIPGPILALSAGPYELGHLLTSYLASTGELDHQFDVFKVGLDQRRVLLPDLPPPPSAAAVKPVYPTLEPGQKPLTFNEYDYGYFADGALSLFLTLSSRLDAADAWRAATVPGLAVTSMPYREQGLVCEKTRLHAEPEAQAVVQAILERWVGASPPSSAGLNWSGSRPQTSVTVTGADGSLLLTSCDPGDAAQDPPKDIFRTLYRFVVAERFVGNELRAENVEPALATCTLETFRATFDARVITDDDFESPSIPASVTEAADAAQAAC